MGRPQNMARAGYFPTPEPVVKVISKFLDFVYYLDDRDKIHLIDIGCGEGKALYLLKESLQKKKRVNIITYGVEINPERGKKAQEVLDKVVIGDAYKLWARRNSFSLCYINPPYHGGKLEFDFLKIGTRYLTPGGILIYIIPYYCLKHKNITHYLSTWYEHFTCLKFPKEEFLKYKQIILIGIKRADKRLTPDKEEMDFFKLISLLSMSEDILEREKFCYYGTEYSRFFDISEIDDLSKIDEANNINELIQGREYFIYKLENSDGSEDGFMLVDVKEEDLIKFSMTSGLEEEVFRIYSIPDIFQNFKPAMTLRRGHLVQILTAGALNGKIADDKGNEIYLKGGIRKEFQEEFQETIQEETIQEGIQEGYKEDWENEVKKEKKMRVRIRRERFVYSIKYWTPEGNLREVSF